MHPSEEIRGEKSNRLRGKTIVIGITGSIAAVECFHLIRDLVRHGASVIPVMTPSATKLVAEDAIEFACGVKPITELTGQTEHIKHLGGRSDADLFMVYPATANTISKMAMGIDDTAVTSMATVALGSSTPVIVAPAMHASMMSNPAVSGNLDTLRSWGVHVIGPHGDGARAKVASKDEIIAWTIRLMSRNDLSGKRILIVGGRSEEPLDSMRLITNRSTGLMAVTLAVRAFERGAEVEMWMGGCNVQIPDHIPVRRYSTVSDLIGMLDSIDHDIVIVPAALADFAPAGCAAGKIPSDKRFDMMLDPVPKVLPLIRRRCGNVIGFKAESGLDRDALEAKARGRMAEYGLRAVVANDIDSAGRTSSSAVFITPESSKDVIGTKVELSDTILDFCAEKL